MLPEDAMLSLLMAPWDEFWAVSTQIDVTSSSWNVNLLKSVLLER